jgi:hypothetical protein
MPRAPRIEFAHHTVPHVEMDSVTDILSRLERADFILMNSTDKLKELIEREDLAPLVGGKILKELSKTFQNDDEESKSYDFTRIKTISVPGDYYPPVDRFLLEPHPAGNRVLNFWIVRKKVMGRPLAFVNSDSSTQMRIPSNFGSPKYKYDPAHKLTIVPDMEEGQIIAFIGSEVWHGSPILDGYGGDRDALVVRISLKQKEVGRGKR